MNKFTRWLFCSDLHGNLQDAGAVKAVLNFQRKWKPEITIFKAVGFEKGGFARNSKVLQAWSRSMFNIAPRDAEDSSLLIVACGKCSDGKEFDPVGVRYNSESGLYVVDASFDIDSFHQQVSNDGGGKKGINRCPVSKVIEYVNETPGILRSELCKLILDNHGLSRQSGYDKIDAAVKSRNIKVKKDSSKKERLYLK